MEELLNNEEFLKDLASVETPAELSETFQRHNIKLEEGMTLEDAFTAVKEHATGELDDASLDQVNGGSIALATGLACVGCFVLGGAALSFLGGYAYQKYKNWRK